MQLFYFYIGSEELNSDVVYVPKGQIDMESKLYNDLKKLYKEHEIFKSHKVNFEYDGQSEEALELEPFTYPSHNQSVNTLSRRKRYDFIVKGTYREGFPILKRYDQMGAVATMSKVTKQPIMTFN